MYEFKQYDFFRESISKTFMRNGIVRCLIRKIKRLDNSALKEFNAWSFMEYLQLVVHTMISTEVHLILLNSDVVFLKLGRVALNETMGT